MEGSEFLTSNESLSGTQRLDRLGQTLFNNLGALRCNAAQIGRRRRGCKHQRQANHRETDSCNHCRNQHMVHVEDVQPEDVDEDILERPDMRSRPTRRGRKRLTTRSERPESHRGCDETSAGRCSGDIRPNVAHSPCASPGQSLRCHIASLPGWRLRLCRCIRFLP